VLVTFKIEKGENSQIFIYFHCSAFMVIVKFFELSKICITTNTVKELFTNVGGKPKMVHKALCELGGVKPDTIIVGSIYNKAKRIVHLIQRLKNCRNENRLHKYLEEKFTFPRRILKRKPSETIEDLNETVKEMKTDIENHERSNLKLREKIIQIGLSRLNQKNTTPKLNYREATKYYQGIKTQNKAFGKRKNKI